MKYLKYFESATSDTKLKNFIFKVAKKSLETYPGLLPNPGHADSSISYFKTIEVLPGGWKAIFNGINRIAESNYNPEVLFNKAWTNIKPQIDSFLYKKLYDIFDFNIMGLVYNTYTKEQKVLPPYIWYLEETKPEEFEPSRGEILQDDSKKNKPSKFRQPKDYIKDIFERIIDVEDKIWQDVFSNFTEDELSTITKSDYHLELFDPIIEEFKNSEEGKAWQLKIQQEENPETYLSPQKYIHSGIARQARKSYSAAKPGDVFSKTDLTTPGRKIAKKHWFPPKVIMGDLPMLSI